MTNCSRGIRDSARVAFLVCGGFGVEVVCGNIGIACFTP
ncbi:DUF3265 domain-containing protein [Vibrio parahaemolyticus]|nr:DUF3265 domain-containing protein [Vibrio parahaemolyticus]MCF9924832.1 DUF3265 domain-containing protein [Vibrio parahaemolyticus]